MTDTPTTGHNNPPIDDIEATLAPYADYIAEAENWLDGTPVETAGQSAAVEALAKQLKAALKAVRECKEAKAHPLHAAHKAEVARWAPTEKGLASQIVCLNAANTPFKNDEAERKAAITRAAFAEANRIKREAEAAAAQANASDIDAQRKAGELRQSAIDAEMAAKATARDAVRGLRTTWHHEITDDRAALIWVAANKPEALHAAVREFVAKEHRQHDIAGVNSWATREAF